MIRRRFLVVLGLLAGTFFLLGFLIQTQLPKVKAWALVRIDQVSKKELPVRILPGSIDIDFFPLGVSLYDVKISPKEEVAQYFDPLSINEVKLRISWFYLLQGRLRLHEVALSGAKANVRIPGPKTKNDKKPLEGLFAQLKQVPLSHLIVEKVDLSLSLEKPRASGQLRNLGISIDNQNNQIGVEVSASGVQFRDADTQALVLLEAEARALLEPDSVTVTRLKVRRGQSYLIAAGRLTGETEALKFEKGDLQARGHLALESMRNWLVKSIPDLQKIPAMKGMANLELDVKQFSLKDRLAEFKIEASDLKVDKFFIGNVTGSGQISGSTVKSKLLQLESNAAKIRVTDFDFTLGEKSPVHATVHVDSMQIHDVLKNLSIGNDIPVFIEGTAKLTCGGEVKPQLLVDCTGNLGARKILVKSKMTSVKPIVALEQLDGVGKLKIDNQAVSYSTDLSMPNSKGKSDGRIAYETGFDINFESYPLAIKDLTSLAGLKLEGSVKVKGKTVGNSKTAWMELTGEASDFWLDDYWLGNFTTNTRFAKDHLTFQNTKGFYTTSRYQGDVDVNLDGNLIDANLQVPFIDIKDLLAAFTRKVKLPFEVTGTGKATIKVSGPLEFTALTYNLKSSIYRGSVLGETFDQANFDIHARSGEVATDRVTVQRGSGLITLTGVGHPTGQIETVVRGKNISLEESENIKKLGINLAGIFDFDMDMRGHVLHPDTRLKGTITKTSLSDRAVADSKLELQFLRDRINGSGQFIGETINGAFTVPLSDEAPYRLNLKTNEWNFAPLLAGVGSAANRKDYDTQVTSQIDLSAEKGGFWNSNGKITAQKFAIRRGALSISAPQPLQLSMQNGQLSVQNFYLAGENIYLRVLDNKNSDQKVDVQVNGKLDMGVVALFLPFFEELRGMLSFAFNVKAGPNSSSLLGSAYIEKGYLKLYDFPHAFEDFKADLLFNQNKVLINSIRGDFASGTFNGDGTLEMKGYKNLPLNFNVRAENVVMNMPDKVETKGSGQFNFSGSWFPFHMKGVYDVQSGVFTKDFGGTSEVGKIRRSDYLPQFLLEETFNPLTMDIQVNFDRGISVKNSLMEGRVDGRLNVLGTTQKPGLLGNVSIEKESKIFFNDAPFEVTSGTIAFTDASEINPKIFLVANTRVQDHDINLVLQGTGQKPEMTLSSTPSLPQNEIISLLALGTTSQQLDTKVASVQQTNSASFSVASGLLKNAPLGRELKDRFGVDLQFSSSFDNAASVALQKITVSGQVTKKLGWNYNRAIGKTSKDEAQLRYRLTDKVSLVGSYEGQANTEDKQNNNEKNENLNVFGLDLEYRFEFK